MFLVHHSHEDSPLFDQLLCVYLSFRSVFLLLLSLPVPARSHLLRQLRQNL